MKVIPYVNHSVDHVDLNSIKKSLHSKLLTGGNIGIEFSNKIKNYLGSKYVVLTSSGTSALHLSFLSINLKKNDNVIMPSINFISSFNMVSKIGANIYLSDVNPSTGQMTPENVEECIKNNNLSKVKCILTMYLGGSPENIKGFFKLKKKYRCALIEDSCHAFGSYYVSKNKKTMVGSNEHSDISTFSFHPVKSIATGEGGCVTTNSKKIYEKILELKNHGMKRNSLKHWDYEIVSNGFNYRISDLNSALGISQLKKIGKFIKKRNLISKIYNRDLKNYSEYISFPKYSKNNTSCFHLLIANFNFDKLKKNKDFFFSYMLKQKIICQYHYKPIYRFKIYKKSVNKNNFKGSENFYKNCLSLPIFYNLNNNQIKYVVNNIKKFIDKYK